MSLGFYNKGQLRSDRHQEVFGDRGHGGGKQTDRDQPDPEKLPEAPYNKEGQAAVGIIGIQFCRIFMNLNYC
jgi:hypothetical protein